MVEIRKSAECGRAHQGSPDSRHSLSFAAVTILVLDLAPEAAFSGHETA